MKDPSRQFFRRAIVAASAPVRRCPLRLARPAIDARSNASAIYQDVDSGTLNVRPAKYADGSPAPRPYDVTTTVLSSDDGSITFRNQHAFDASRRLLFEENIPFDVLPVAFERLDEPIEEHANIAYLSNTWPTNFYHWMCLTLPLLRHYEAAGVDIDRVYVGGKLTSWQQRSLELCGIASDRVVTAPSRARAASVAVSTRLGGGVAPSQLEWTRAHLVPEGPSGGNRRLFVGRGETTTRRMLDEEVLAAALEREFGFEYVITSQMTLDEEIELFGSADTIVAPYGAALTNVLFCEPGAKVLELQAHDADFAASTAFMELSQVLGHQHGIIRGDYVPPAGRAISTDIKFSVDEVLPEVEAMLIAQ